MKFYEILPNLEKGQMIMRKSWEGKKFVCKQVPSEIYCNIIPKMSSLPADAKEELFSRDKSLFYNNQLIEVFEDNQINSWSVNSSDLFANDWFVFAGIEAVKENSNDEIEKIKNRLSELRVNYISELDAVSISDEKDLKPIFQNLQSYQEIATKHFIEYVITRW